MRCRKFIKALVCHKHLAKRIESVGPTPGLFDSLNMLRFSNGRTNAIWGPKCSNRRLIVDKGVLPRKGKPIRTHAALLEDLAVLMELF
jgi:hypothetical protein